MKLKENKINFFQYLKDYGYAPKTINHYRFFLDKIIIPVMGDYQINSLSISDSARLVALGKPYGIYGSQRVVSVYRCFLKYLHDSGIKIPFDYRDITLPKVPHSRIEYLDAEELDMIRNSFDISDLSGLRTRALIEVLLDTGMRISEVISLDKDDINWDKKEALITNTKTKEREIVYFTDRSIYWLKQYLDKRKDDLPALFVSGRNRLLSVTSRNYIRTKTRNLPINKKICHHIFRRTLATTLLQNKVDIKSVQILLRHKSERTTLKYYTGVSQERVKVLHEQTMKNI